MVTVPTSGEFAWPEHVTDECIRRRDEEWHDDAAFCQITLDTCHYPTLYSKTIFCVALAN